MAGLHLWPSGSDSLPLVCYNFLSYYITSDTPKKYILFNHNQNWGDVIITRAKDEEEEEEEEEKNAIKMIS